jgi:hypothetical protein
MRGTIAGAVCALSLPFSAEEKRIDFTAVITRADAQNALARKILGKL